MKIKRSILVAMVFGWSCNQSAGPDSALAFNPKVNDTFKIDFFKKTVDKTFARTDSIQFTAEIKCMQNKDSIVVLKITIQHIQFSKRATAEPFDWNSLFSDLRNYSAIITMNKSGNIYSVTKIKPFGEVSIDKTKYNPEEIGFIVDQYLSENSMMDYFNRVFTVVPNKRVMVGDLWGSSIYLRSKAPVKIASTYTLESLRSDTAHINIASIISARQGIDGTFYLEGKQSGKTMISYSTGVVFSYETNAESIYSAKDYKVSIVETLKLSRK
jgi:hypothetical protein